MLKRYTCWSHSIEADKRKFLTADNSAPVEIVASVSIAVDGSPYWVECYRDTLGRIWVYTLNFGLLGPQAAQ